MDLFQEIINGGKPDEIKESLCVLMQVGIEEPLRLSAVLKFLKEQGVDSDGRETIGVYLMAFGLLDEIGG